MATYYTNAINATRFLNSSLVDQSGSDDTSVIGWDRTAVFVLAATIYCSNGTSRNPIAGTYQLMWRNKTDSPAGAYTDVTATGEIKYSTATNLTNDNTVSAGVCGVPTGYSFTALQSFQIEDGLSPSSDLGAAGCAEMRFGLSVADGLNGKEYDFKIYDPTNSLDLGVCGATLTTKKNTSFIMFDDDDILI